MKYCYNCLERIENSASVCPYCKKDPAYSAPPSHLRPGTMLNGKYVVGRALGQGGFGITYLGRDTALDAPVAIKEYFWRECAERNNLVSNEITLSVQEHKDIFAEGKNRFIKEARTLAKFRDDPSVVSVWDVFEENNTAYLVMEYLRGTDLAVYLQNRGRMSSSELLPKLRPIIQALEEIHRQGIIHRDIKPQNIMLMSNGRLKLLDFGAAREFGGDKSLTAILSPGFAPEEQYRRKGKQGPWTDVYALCATIYYCLTRAVPEDSRDRAMEDKDELKAPSALGAEVSRDEEAAILRGLAIRSKDRFQSMEELEHALFPETGKPNSSGAGSAMSQIVFRDGAISVDRSSSFSPAQKGIEPHGEKTIDYVFCIDLSKRMRPHTKTVREQLVKLVQETLAQTHRRYAVRGRLILFSNLPADQNIFSTEFFDCATGLSNLTDLLDRAVQCLSSNEDGEYVSGLEALSDAMNSSWGAAENDKKQIIVLWSNGVTRDEGAEKSLACPRSFSQLSKIWNSDSVDQAGKALVLFTPVKGDWKRIADTWDKTSCAPRGMASRADDGEISGIVSALLS